MKQNHKGFTLLEIIIVIIIVGVLASLALPRFFATVEFSRSNEALTNMSALRQALERCYLSVGGTYANCNETSVDIDNPSTAPGALFSYAVSGQGATGYLITATRNTISGGVSTSLIYLSQSAAGSTRSGATKFIGIK